MLIDRINEIARARAGGLSRRAFIKVGAAAGGGLLLSVSLPVFRGDAEAATDVFAPDAFIRIDADGQVTMVMPQVEMGQGTYTSIPMLIAEELEVELATVQLEHAPPNDKLYANPLIGFQATGGSTSVRGFWEPLRRAGATARNMLISAAADTWGVAASDCRAEKGVVTHAASGRKLGYGELAAKAAGLPVPEKVALKDPKDFTLIGTPAKRLDTPAKVNGTAMFGIDTQLPGMKIATVAISPVFGGKLAKVDDSKALAVKGVRQVVKLDDAVAVVADHMGAAKKGMEALEITWDEGANAKLSTGDILQQLESAAAKPGVIGAKEGDVEKAIAGAAKKIEANYHMPFLAHAAMEPMNCTVHVTKDSCEVWVGHPGRDQGAGHGRRCHGPAAGEGAGAQPSAGRRLRPAARYRRRDPGGPDRQAGRWPGEGGLDPRGGYPARYLPALLLRPAHRGARCGGRARGLASSRRRLLHPGALVSGRLQGRPRFRRGGRGRRALRLSQCAGRLRPAGAAGGPPHRLVAGRRHHPQRLHRRRLHRRACRRGGEGSRRISRRAAGQIAPRQGRARSRRGEIRLGREAARRAAAAASRCSSASAATSPRWPRSPSTRMARSA